MRVTKFHPELAPPPLGKSFEEGTEPTGDGWVDHPSEFPNTKVYLYHPWKAPRGQTFEQGEEPEDPAWVSSRKLLPPVPDPGGPIHHMNRGAELARVAEVLRVRGYPKRNIRGELSRINQSACSPPLDDQHLALIVEGTNEIRMPHLLFIAQDVAAEFAKKGQPVESIYEALTRINNERGAGALSDDSILDICNQQV